jgi:hypothetical protein
MQWQTKPHAAINAELCLVADTRTQRFGRTKMHQKHFGPISVTIYADGYTSAQDSACGRFVATETDPTFFTILTLNTEHVTCKHCRKTHIFSSALLHFSSPLAAIQIRHVDRMRTKVFRAGGKYDVARNNKLREFLSLQPLHISETEIKSLYERELKFHEEYAKRHLGLK